MTLRNYQREIELDTLYEVRYKPAGTEQIQPTLEIIGGGATIYGSQVLPESPPTGMYATKEDFEGIIPFAAVPNYIYITEASGTITSLVTSGLEIKEVE